jgi:hypothetical protein
MALAPLYEHPEHQQFRAQRSRPAKPTVGEALERTYGAGRRLASHHLDLVTLELQTNARRYGGAIGLLVVGGAIGLLGWIGLAGALVAWDWGGAFPVETRLALVAAAHLVLGLALAGAGARRLGKEPDSDAAGDSAAEGERQ